MKTNSQGFFPNSRLIIVQEVFPVYREKLFDGISDKVNFKLLVSNEKLGDINVLSEKDYVICVGRVKGLFKNRIYWQTGILSFTFKKNDVVVLPASPRNIASVIVLLKLRLMGVKTVLWGHYESATGTKLGYIIRMLLLKIASGLLFYTDLEVQRYRSTSWGRRESRIIMGLNNGSNYDEIKKYVVPYELNYLDRRFNILFIGRLTEKTKLSFLLKAINCLEYTEKITLHVIGSGALKTKLNEEADLLGVSIIWHGTLTLEKEISKVANICSMFVYPGNVGLSLIHAMSYGLPCIVHSNRANQNPEVDALFENKDSVFFKENDILDLSNKINLLFNSKELKVKNSNCNVKIIKEKYNINSMVKKFLLLYTNLH